MNNLPVSSVPDVSQVPAPMEATAAPRQMLREPLRFVLFALGIGFLTDALFRGGAVPVGINAPILFVAFLICLGFLARREGVSPKRAAFALFASPLLFFAAMLAVRANSTLAFYNFSACGILTLLLLHFWGDGNPFTATFGAWLALPWKAFGGTLASVSPVLQRASGQVVVPGERRERYAAVGRGVLLAVPVLIVFAALFANADEGFAKRINEVTAWFFPDDWGVQATRFFWTIATTFAVTGGFAYSLTRRETFIPTVKPPSTPFGLTEAGIVLGTVSALFGAFLLTQTKYLFGGDAHVQKVPDLTYADYAHHGFAELNIVAILTLALIGGLKALTKRETPAQSRTFSLLATALLTLTFPLLASAFSRMTAYELAYGATELRLYVDLFMAWLAVGLLWCGTTLWAKKVPGGIGIYACAVGFLISLNVVNPDRDIARRNIERYQKMGRMDREYLATLSEDAFPELMRLYKSSSPEDTLLLRRIANRHQSNSRVKEWGAWNLSKAQAQQIIGTMKRNPMPVVAPASPEIVGTR